MGKRLYRCSVDIEIMLEKYEYYLYVDYHEKVWYISE